MYDFNRTSTSTTLHVLVLVHITYINLQVPGYMLQVYRYSYFSISINLHPLLEITLTCTGTFNSSMMPHDMHGIIKLCHFCFQTQCNLIFQMQRSFFIPDPFNLKNSKAIGVRNFNKHNFYIYSASNYIKSERQLFTYKNNTLIKK